METEEKKPSPGRIRFLMVARIVLLATSFGLSVAAAVVLVIGVVRLLTGSTEALQSALSVMMPAGVALVAARFGLPRIDREVLDQARRAQGPEFCLPLIGLLNSPAVALRPAPIEAELVRLLATIDEGWWRASARDLREQLGAATEAAKAPSGIRPAGVAWLPALFDAMARFGRTEYLPLLERLERVAATHPVNPGIAGAAQRAAEALRERKRRDMVAAMLLRPAEPPGAEALLRPARVGASGDPAMLLRPVEGAGEGAPIRVEASTDPNRHEASDQGAEVVVRGVGERRGEA